jgi:hypothetical protein
LYKNRIPIYVARADQEIYLKDAGYRFVHSIGMPMVYLPTSKVERIPNSLLVMPSHSTDETRHEWNFKEFAKNLSRIIVDYQFVAACIHPSCIRKGYWIKEMADLGIPIIEGATITDRNALLRVQSLLSLFSNVVGNGFGSHLVYSEYLGANVSLIPPWPVETVEDYERNSVYKNQKDAITKLIEVTQEDGVRKDFPLFFDSTLSYGRDWGAWQLGEDHKKSPSEIKKILGWDLPSRLKFSLFARLRKRSDLEPM